jgi:hypothetical protein
MNTLARPTGKIGWLIVGVIVVPIGARIAGRIVRLLSHGDPDMARLLAAPIDREPLTSEQWQEIKAAVKRLDAGEGVPLEEALPEPGS